MNCLCRVSAIRGDTPQGAQRTKCALPEYECVSFRKPDENKPHTTVDSEAICRDQEGFGNSGRAVALSPHDCGSRINQSDHFNVIRALRLGLYNRQYFLPRGTHRTVCYCRGRAASAREGSQALLE